ncbi:hypothetical protein PGB90_007852 [Kerria lacca]
MGFLPGNVSSKLFLVVVSRTSIRNLKIKEDKCDDLKISTVNFNAGTEIVLQNEQDWKEIHKLFEENAYKAENIDFKISEIHTKMEKQLQQLQEITNFVTNIPKFVKRIEGICERLASFENMVQEVEKFLVIFEDLVEIEEYKQKEVNEKFEYNAYIQKKSQEMEFVTKTLDEQYRKKLLIKEKKLEGQLKERQELFSMAFEQDMQLYKESGIMPNLRSTEGPRLSLEDVIIEDNMQSLNELLDNC